jgi:hypothetical protein
MVVPSARCAVSAPLESKTRPHLAAVMKHLALSLLMASVVPSVLFYVCLRTGGVWTALVVALVWCYGVTAWRVVTKRRTSMLLMIAAAGLTAKTVLAFASGSTFIYFLQPAVNDAVFAVVFMLSLATARPVAARLAGDFYPMTDDIASRPRMQRLFWNLTLLWAVLAILKCVVTICLLVSMPTVQFVAVRGAFIVMVLVAGAVVTVATSVRAARAEGLLHTA